MESLAGVPPLSRKEKRKIRKKLRRKELRQQAAKEEHDLLDSTPEKIRIESEEQIEAERIAAEQADHDEQEKLWLEREEKAMEDFRIRQEERRKLDEDRKNWDVEDDAGSTDEDLPAEVIWQGNEIIVKKPRVKRSAKPHPPPTLHDADNSAENPASNPLPPQTAVFAARTQQHQPQTLSEQAPTFGTEQDKTNCPFHIKTGVCRFGVRCSRVHVYPDQSFTLLMRNMYIGPGLTWENDEGLERRLPDFCWTSVLLETASAFGGEIAGNRKYTIHSDEEVALHYEEFYEDVHSEFLQFGELVNFKVCNNSSLHLRGNVYVHYKTEAAAQAAYSVMNGRFYAGRQITCEFVGVTRWRTALCGEYMKFNYRLCSHGTACNFLHCFRNPRGEYDWADWDSNPPRYWAVKMAKLFGREASFEEEHDDHGHARSAWTRESLSRERYRHQSRHDFEHGSSQRTRRRHSSESEYSYSDSDESSRNSRRRGRHAHHRPSIFTGGKSTVIRDNSTRVFRTGSREPVDNEFHELEGDIRQKRHPSPNSTDHGIRRGLLEDGEHIRRSDTYSGKDGEKHSRHRKRHRSKSRDELDDGQFLRSEFHRSRHRSTSSDVENDSTKYIRSGNRNERETETFSRKRKESYGSQRRREGFSHGDSSDSGSTDRNNFSRKGQRKPRRRRSTERQSRKGGHIGIVEKNTSLDIDDRWTGSYDS